MIRPTRIIGLCGRAKVGKSTTARAIEELSKHRYEVWKIPFAKPVKEIAMQFGWDGQKDERGRRLLQLIGTEVGRGYNPNIWIEKWEAAVDPLIKRGGCLVLVDDVRFQNEINCIRSAGGMVARIICGSRQEKLEHASEQVDNLDINFQITVPGSEPPQSIADRILKYAELHYKEKESEVK